MKNLHRAALVRAYRTLAQGLGGSALSTILVSLFTEGSATVPALVASVGAVLVAAFVSFWQGVAQGLPEASDE